MGLPSEIGAAPFLLNVNVTEGLDCVGECLLTRRADGSWSLSPVHADAGDDAWVLLCTFLVISMQTGFAILEVGSCRAAHRMTVLAKNVLDSVISGIALMVHCEVVSPSIVTSKDDGLVRRHLYAFHWAFCATSVTICSGSMAERAHMGSYVCYSVVMAGLIYPVIAEAAWGRSGSFLHSQFHGAFHGGTDYHDFAGSGVVHFLGGCCAFAGNSLLGRRIAKIGTTGQNTPNHSPNRNCEGVTTPVGISSDEETAARHSGRWPRRFDSPERDEDEFMPCCYLQVIGMFLLWVGWYGFNAGGCLAMTRSGSVVAGIVVWNTTIAACAGGLGAYVFCLSFRKMLDVSLICNGVLSGLVSITASCDVATQTVAFVVGLTAGLIVYPLSCSALRLLKMDDPVDAIPVHLFNGLFGLLVTGVCKPNCEYMMQRSSGLAHTGFCAEDHAILPQIAAQAWGAFIMVIWSLSISFVMWGCFALGELSRASEIKVLESADEILSSITTGNPQASCNERWVALFTQARAARKVFLRYGFTEKGFESDMSCDMWRLRRELQQVRNELDSGLEMSVNFNAGILRWCARFCQSLYCFHRLRITPAAEISGLGAADIDGGRLVKKLSKALLKLDQDAKQKAGEKEILEREVRQLSMVVRGQATLLQQMQTGGRSSGPSRHGQLQSSEMERRARTLRHLVQQAATSEVPGEDQTRVSVASSASDTDVLPEPLSPNAPSVPASLQSGVRFNPLTSGTVSTTSSGIHGMTPRSELSATPPPTHLGMDRLPAQGGYGRPLPTTQQDAFVQEVARQLAEVTSGRNQ